MGVHASEREQEHLRRNSYGAPLNMEGDEATGEEVLDNHSARLVTGTVVRASLLAVPRQKQREEMERLLMALCVLPENQLLPITVCDVIWQHALQPEATPAVKRRSKLRSRQLLSCLMERGLVEGSMQSGWCFLHHLIHGYCTTQHSEADLATLHKAMARALLENRPEGGFELMPRYISRLAVRPLQGREMDWYCSSNLAHHCRQGWGGNEFGDMGRGGEELQALLMPLQDVDKVVAHTIQQLQGKGSNSSNFRGYGGSGGAGGDMNM